MVNDEYDDAEAKAPGRLTLKQIAAIVGVSTATVSRVLNPGRGGAPVSEETRQRVLEAAQGYTQRSRKKAATIGVIVPTLMDPAYAELTQSLISSLDEAGLVAIVSVSTTGETGDDRQRAAISALLDQGVSGIIAVPADSTTSDQSWQLVTDRQLPLIFVDRRGGNPGLPVDVVRFDDRNAAKAATQYLLEQGHLRIGILASEGDAVSRERLEGVFEAFSEKNVPEPEDELIWIGDLGVEHKDHEAREEGVRSLLRLPQPPTAIFALDMRLCESALAVIRRLKLAIPFDISLVTFEDAAWRANPSSSHMKLTTIVRSMDQLAKRAVRQLALRMEHAGSDSIATERSQINVYPQMLEPDTSVIGTQYQGLVGSVQPYAEHVQAFEAASASGSDVAPMQREWQATNYLELGKLEVRLARYDAIPLLDTEPGLALAQTLPENLGTSVETDSASPPDVATWLQGNPEDAEDHFRKGLELARGLDRQQRSATTCDLLYEFLMRLGKLKGHRGEYEQAQVYLAEGLSLAEHMVNPYRRGDFHMHLAWIKGNQGNYGDAETHLRAGFEDADTTRALDDTDKPDKTSKSDKLRSGLLMNLGWIAHCQGDFVTAGTALQDGLKIARRLNHQIRICGLLENLCMVARYRGELTKAWALVDEGLPLAQRNEHPARRCGLLERKVWCLIDDRAYDKARGILEEGFALAYRMRYPVRICGFLQASGCLDLLQARDSANDPQQQAAYLQNASKELLAASSLAERSRHRFLTTAAYTWLGELRLASGEWDEAEARFRQAHRLAGTGGMIPMLAGWAEYGLARACAKRGDRARALAHGNASKNTLTSIAGLKLFGFHRVDDVTAWLRRYERQQV